jgi:diguanylate cyclase (GGDEF)-like protein
MDFDPHLVILGGQELGRHIRVGDDPVRIGRAEECEIVVTGDSVSRNHATILRVANTVLVRDLGSTNGTFVNDQRVKVQELKDGDRIRTGKVVLKYLANGSVEVAAHRQLFDRANRDPLTGAFNKRYFDEALEREAERCLAEGRALSLVTLDIDHFKRINDTHGHVVGDEVLTQFGQIVKTTLRGNDIFCRTGGEEFCVILPGASLAVGYVCGERLREQVEEHLFLANSERLVVTVSGGVAEYQPNEPLNELKARSDERLYQAKEAGRNRVH